MVSHKHALELKRCADTRGREESKEIKRDETVQEIKERGTGLRTQKNHHLLVSSTFRCFARTPPAADLKGLQLPDYRAIEKGVEKTEPIPKELN